MQKQIHPLVVESLQDSQEIRQRTPQPVDRPCRQVEHRHNAKGEREKPTSTLRIIEVGTPTPSSQKSGIITRRTARTSARRIVAGQRAGETGSGSATTSAVLTLMVILCRERADMGNQTDDVAREASFRTEEIYRGKNSPGSHPRRSWHQQRPCKARKREHRKSARSWHEGQHLADIGR